jgi:acyl-CoA reductase-like NAD-dependent aldehyde dehydrogenase
LKAIELAQTIFPPGVVQVLGGDDKLGPMFTEHPGIAKISFTGSIATGKKIMAACSKTLKRVTLELGGNDASIVREDVDIEATAPQLVMGAFQNSGQVCRAIPLLLADANFFIRSALPPSVSTFTRRSTNQ